MSEGESKAQSGAGGKVHADPTKDFFVTMITRDLSLQDSIFDLLDNSIDGARRTAAAPAAGLDGFKVSVSFDERRFEVSDNCGGIRLSDAIDYAFHFGRRPDAPKDVQGSIGLYGIGMKRAIFKIGRRADIESETTDDSFTVNVDVDGWEKSKDWDFDYDDKPKTGTTGTRIVISTLNAGAAKQFSDPAFANSLVTAIARDYAFFILKGFAIEVCGRAVPSYRYELKRGKEVSPASVAYEDDGVAIRIAAGLIDDLPDEIPEELRPEAVQRYGWFVVCNDRVVLAADKTNRTIWGDDGYRVWHPQYNGFAGFVFFGSNDPSKLPWKTTKRELDVDDPLYRRTLAQMKKISDDFIEYTNRRKADLEGARAAEKTTEAIDVRSLTTTARMTLPRITGTGPRTELITIAYQKDRRAVDEIKHHLGTPTISAKEVGSRTFDYFRKMELGKK